MKIGPYTVSRGTMLPYIEEDRRTATVRTAADGSIVVTEQAFSSEVYFRVKIKVPRGEARDIRGFLRGVGYARDTFTYEDGFGVAHTVRFMDSKIRRRNIAGGLVELDLLLREEVVA